MVSDTISAISLQGVMPLIFANDSSSAKHAARSQVWDRDISFTRGHSYLIQAESGIGKSSLISFLYGLRGDYRGSIFFDSQCIASLSRSQWGHLRRNALAVLPQQLDLFPELTVLENINIKNSLTAHQSKQWISTALEALEIDSKANTQARFLSLGQQQRVAIVRALCQPFSFLLLDEPVSHLDARNNSGAASLITTELNRQGAALIATSVGNHLNYQFTDTLML